jgi:hypothetical protein
MNINAKLAAWSVSHEHLISLDISQPIEYSTFGLSSETHIMDFRFLKHDHGPFGVLTKTEFYNNLHEIQQIAYMFHPTKYLQYFKSEILDVRDNFEKVLKDSFGVELLPNLYLDKQWKLYCLIDFEHKVTECELAKILLTTTMFIYFKEKNQHLFK